jgi:hypothetical protein
MDDDEQIEFWRREVRLIDAQRLQLQKRRDAAMREIEVLDRQRFRRVHDHANKVPE